MTVLGLAMLVVIAAGQEVSEAPPVLRRRTVGKVRRRNGKPWAGARVMLTAVADYGELAVPIERVSAVTDARGRFRVELLTSVRYSAWGMGPVAGDGSFHCTKVRAVHAGRPVILDEAEKVRVRATVALLGRGAWRDYEPLRLRIRRPAGDFVEHAFARNRDSLLLPPLPGPSVRVAVLGKHGNWIHDATVAVVRGEEVEARVRLPNIPRVIVRVVHGGKPVVGADVCDFFHWFGRLATTGPRGRAIVPTIYTGVLAPVVCHAPGLGERACYLRLPGEPNSRWAPQHPMKVDEKSDLASRWRSGAVDAELELRPGVTLTARVLSTRDQPVSGAALVVYRFSNQDPQWFEGYGYPIALVGQVLRTDADGRFTLDWLGPGVQVVIDLVLPAKALAQLPDPRVHPAVCLFAGQLSKKRGCVDLGEIRLDRRPVTEIALRYAGGSPVRHGLLLWMESYYGAGMRGQHYVTADAHGVVRLLVPEDSKLRVAAGGRRDGRFVPSAKAAAVVPGKRRVELDVGPRRTGR